MKKSRKYYSNEMIINSWDDLKIHFENLTNENIETMDLFESFLEKISELESIVSEDMAWRYIKMTCDTNNKDLETSYLKFVTEIQPEIAPFEDVLNKKIVQSPFVNNLENEKEYFIYFRSLKNSINLFREENIPLISEAQTLSQKYGQITGGLSVEWENKELTLQQASNKLKSTDRETRKNAYEKIGTKRLECQESLNTLLNELISVRHQVAHNAGFDNFRDYMHQSMGRYDYSVEDCFNFHKSIEKVVVPLAKKLEEERLTQLGYDVLKPYDMAVDTLNREPLKPFENGKELLEKTIQCFNQFNPDFSNYLKIMEQNNLFDLESRIGKAPGGYNYPLAESGVPFIFMNAAGSLRDVETMVHEAGHAFHSFLSHPLKLNAFKNAPMEVAEVASMSMELISMTGWVAYFDSSEELKRAKIEQLEGVVSTLSWIAIVDCFQHWLYLNPKHTVEERTAEWKNILKRFDTGMVDYSGYENLVEISWQKQLHIYEVPFYYIEYGFAQLGAIALWKLYSENPEKGLAGYKNMLSKGFTLTIPELYESAGIKFDFSTNYVQELFDFVWAELEKLKV